MRDKVVLGKTFLALLGVYVALLGVGLLLGYHPIFNSVSLAEDIFKYLSKVLPYRMYGLICLILGGIVSISLLRSRGVSNGK